MDEHTKKGGLLREGRPVALGELIHAAVRRAIEVAVARRVKTQGSLPTEDAALVLLFGLVVSGQIRLRGRTGGATSRRCSASDGAARHDASRIGVRIAFDEHTDTEVCPEIAPFLVITA